MSTEETNREINATQRWGVGLLIGLLLQGAMVFYWASALNSQVEQNTKDIDAVQSDVKSIDRDIRTILVGIEQVKARLGVVEVK